MPNLLQNLQALETTIAKKEGPYLADGDYHIQQALKAVSEAADAVHEGQLSNELIESCLDRLVQAREKLEERSRRNKRSRQNLSPEGKGYFETTSSRLRGLMTTASNAGGGGEESVADAEMDEGNDDEQEIIT